nr:hypothetical protein [Chlamydiota bacterium]
MDVNSGFFNFNWKDYDFNYSDGEDHLNDLLNDFEGQPESFDPFDDILRSDDFPPSEPEEMVVTLAPQMSPLPARTIIQDGHELHKFFVQIGDETLNIFNSPFPEAMLLWNRLISVHKIGRPLNNLEIEDILNYCQVIMTKGDTRFAKIQGYYLLCWFPFASQVFKNASLESALIFLDLLNSANINPNFSDPYIQDNVQSVLKELDLRFKDFIRLINEGHTWAPRIQRSCIESAVSRQYPLNSAPFSTDLSSNLLFCAIKWRNLEAIRYLLEKGALPNGSKGDSKTIFEYLLEDKWCESEEGIEAIKLMVKSKATIPIASIGLHHNLTEYRDCSTDRGYFLIFKNIQFSQDSHTYQLIASAHKLRRAGCLVTHFIKSEALEKIELIQNLLNEPESEKVDDQLREIFEHIHLDDLISESTNSPYAVRFLDILFRTHNIERILKLVLKDDDSQTLWNIIETLQKFAEHGMFDHEEKIRFLPSLSLVHEELEKRGEYWRPIEVSSDGEKLLFRFNEDLFEGISWQIEPVSEDESSKLADAIQKMDRGILPDINVQFQLTLDKEGKVVKRWKRKLIHLAQLYPQFPFQSSSEGYLLNDYYDLLTILRYSTKIHPSILNRFNSLQAHLWKTFPRQIELVKDLFNSNDSDGKKLDELLNSNCNSGWALTPFEEGENLLSFYIKKGDTTAVNKILNSRINKNNLFSTEISGKTPYRLLVEGYLKNNGLDSNLFIHGLKHLNLLSNEHQDLIPLLREEFQEKFTLITQPGETDRYLLALEFPEIENQQKKSVILTHIPELCSRLSNNRIMCQVNLFDASEIGIKPFIPILQKAFPLYISDKIIHIAKLRSLLKQHGLDKKWLLILPFFLPVDHECYLKFLHSNFDNKTLILNSIFNKFHGKVHTVSNAYKPNLLKILKGLQEFIKSPSSEPTSTTLLSKDDKVYLEKWNQIKKSPDMMRLCQVGYKRFLDQLKKFIEGNTQLFTDAVIEENGIWRFKASFFERFRIGGENIKGISRKGAIRDFITHDFRRYCNSYQLGKIPQYFGGEPLSFIDQVDGAFAWLTEGQKEQLVNAFILDKVHYLTHRIENLSTEIDREIYEDRSAEIPAFLIEQDGTNIQLLPMKCFFGNAGHPVAYCQDYDEAAYRTLFEALNLEEGVELTGDETYGYLTITKKQHQQLMDKLQNSSAEELPFWVLKRSRYLSFTFSRKGRGAGGGSQFTSAFKNSKKHFIEDAIVDQTDINTARPRKRRKTKSEATGTSLLQQVAPLTIEGSYFKQASFKVLEKMRKSLDLTNAYHGGPTMLDWPDSLFDLSSINVEEIDLGDLLLPLKPYQRKTQQTMEALKTKDLYPILAFEAGLGKTITYIQCILNEILNGNQKDHLIVTPRNTAEQAFASVKNWIEYAQFISMVAFIRNGMPYKSFKIWSAIVGRLDKLKSPSTMVDDECTITQLKYLFAILKIYRFDPPNRNFIMRQFNFRSS